MSGTVRKLELAPKLVPLYNELIKQTSHGNTDAAPLAAYNFLRAAPCIDDDFFMSRVVALAIQYVDADNAVFNDLAIPGSLTAVQLLDFYARQLDFDSRERYIPSILEAAQRGNIGLEELSLVSIRTLLHEANLLNEAQLAYVTKTYAQNVRQNIDGGSGIWLGARATVGALSQSLKSIIEHTPQHLDRIGLVLITQNGQVNQGVLDIAKQFRKALLVNYQTENELVERLRALNMHTFIEMHGMQNAASFLHNLRFGVATYQLSWAGLPESCPVPFLDGQILDPILSQSTHKSARPIPLRCWLPPIVNYPTLIRGQHLGIWTQSAKISLPFLRLCAQIAMDAGCRLQVYTGKELRKPKIAMENVDFVDTLIDFQPSVLLDTSPISGGASCLIALHNNIPVVTLPGAALSTRLGASILLNYGFPDGVASDLDDFRLRALELHKNKSPVRISKRFNWELADTVSSFFA